ncbi:MAG: hypothetical protein JNL28_07275 [Planctomycetes bacterium]|nr:hypothetical protein [Planctomycetota bacterium]
MNRRGIAALVAWAACTAGSAVADGRNPGSLLVYPEFDSTPGRAALLTLTNVNPDIKSGLVRVEIVFVNGTAATGGVCLETNATVQLTPNDTLTLLASALNPNVQKGYAYAFAKNAQGAAISFNWLIGDNLLFDGVDALDYTINPYSFRAIRPQGQPTDADADGVRDLNGIEYEMAPAKIIVPRFFGQSGVYQSDLVLIALTGGGQFTSTINFLIYNDNEEVFSGNYAFRCWTKTPLTTITNVFTQSFLANFTSHAPNETIGATTVETGWFEMDGGTAYSTSTQFADPAFLAFLVERTGPRSGAELSFEMGRQSNGDLLPLSINGDTN